MSGDVSATTSINAWLGKLLECLDVFEVIFNRAEILGHVMFVQNLFRLEAIQPQRWDNAR